jgi:hypothetical protein
MDDRSFAENVSDAFPPDNEEPYLELLRLLFMLDGHPKLFPKICRVCGLQFNSLSDYVRLTVPKGHGIEDCSEVMNKPFTMMYRHCRCGNTLVTAITEEHMPQQRVFWDRMRSEAYLGGKTLNQVAAEFVDYCDRVLKYEDEVSLPR